MDQILNVLSVIEWQRIHHFHDHEPLSLGHVADLVEVDQVLLVVRARVFVSQIQQDFHYLTLQDPKHSPSLGLLDLEMEEAVNSSTTRMEQPGRISVLLYITVIALSQIRV